jgi:drug/metabolite transporter (DMT)-like permease
MSSRPTLRGIAAMVLATGAFVANDSCMKLALAETPPMETLFLRGLSATIWCLPAVLFAGHGCSMALIASPWVLARSFCEAMAIFCFIYALKHMPISDVTAILQLVPLILLVMSALIWNDRIGGRRWGLIGLGVAGALLVAQPGASTASPFALFGFVAVVGAAFRDLISRLVPATVPAPIVALSTVVTVMALSLGNALAFETWVTPSPGTIGLVAAAGLFLVIGHICVFLAFRLATARSVAPFVYCFMIWAVLSGLFVFGDAPNGIAVLGMLLIAAAGLANVLLERRSARA